MKMDSNENIRKLNVFYKIKHSPLIITNIFEFTLERPFILFQIIEKSKNLKKKLANNIIKENDLCKETNNLYSLFFNTLYFDNLFKEIMTNEINIEQEENNYYITKPNINLLYEENLEQLFNEYKIYLPNKQNSFFTKALIEYCINKPIISLSINLFTKENNNNFNFEFTESDLDINYIKYLNQKENINVLKKQKFRLIINIYNRYNNITFNNKKNDKDKKKNYLTNINLIKKLKIQEIYFIRPSFYKNNIEKIYNQDSMIEEIKIMFNLLKSIE